MLVLGGLIAEGFSKVDNSRMASPIVPTCALRLPVSFSIFVFVVSNTVDVFLGILLSRQPALDQLVIASWLGNLQLVM